MIHHASIAVRDVDQCAQVMAKLIQGRIGRLPFNPETAIVMAKDSHGTAIEFWPMNTRFTPDIEGNHVKIEQIPVEEPRSAVHLFISVPKTPDEVYEIAKEAGWMAVERKIGAPFRLIELWVEGHTMLEVCPEVWLPLYLKALGEMPAS